MDAECGKSGLKATTPERWRQIESILDAALEQAAEQRLAWVAEACGSDADLRHEVESLLAGDARIESFLESPALGPAEAAQPLAPQLVSGEQLGPYRIVAPLGTAAGSSRTPAGVSSRQGFSRACGRGWASCGDGGLQANISAVLARDCGVWNRQHR
jgi:hypothetical protein